MDSPGKGPARSSPVTTILHLWSAHRRAIFLVSLVMGLAAFLAWLPDMPRATLRATLEAQQVLISMLFVFALIVVSMVWSAGQRVDTWVFLLFNLRGYHHKWLDRVMFLITQLGNVGTAVVLAGLFFVLNQRSVTVVIVLGTLTLWLLVEVIKVLTDRSRPFLALEGTRVIGWRERGRSFPSGHTSQTFFLMTLLSYQFHLGPQATLALFAVAVLVGFSRIYVGVHYPRDVLGGAVLGSVWGVLATLVDPYWYGLWF